MRWWDKSHSVSEGGLGEKLVFGSHVLVRVKSQCVGGRSRNWFFGVVWERSHGVLVDRLGDKSFFRT